MSYKLFLDDIRSPAQVVWAKLPENVSWHISRSFKDFREALLLNGIPDFVAFDCDLAEEHYTWANRNEFLVKQYAGEFQEKTGIDCAIFLIKQCKVGNRRPPEFVVHSMNVVGGGEITRLMIEAQKEFDKSSPVG